MSQKPGLGSMGRLNSTAISLHPFPLLLCGFAAAHLIFKSVFQNHSEEPFLLNASEIQVTSPKVSNQQSLEQLAV